MNKIKNKIKKIGFKKEKKAQVWALDLAIAILIFIGVIFLFYRYSISFSQEELLINKMIKESAYVTNTLLSTGYPENWNELDLKKTNSIGLLNEKGLLDLNKINTFREWVSNENESLENYSLSKKKINTKYNYFITFTNSTTEVLKPIGLNFQNKNPKQIIKIQRLVAYNDSQHIRLIKMNLFLWTSEIS